MHVLMLSLMSGLLFWPGSVSAELYKWTDGEGNFHITDTPPPGAQKKSSASTVPAPHSTPLNRTRIRPTLPGQPQAEVHPIPHPPPSAPADESVPVQLTLEGLSPRHATLTSSWQVFESSQVNAKAPVQWWKDQQDLDHFADVLPVAGKGTEAGGKIENVSASHPTRRAKERATGISHSRHQTTE